MMRFECPHCGAKLRVPEANAGKEGRCPRCKKTLAVPQAPEPELELIRDEAAADARITPELPGQSGRRPLPLPGGRRNSPLDRQQDQELLASLGPLPAPEHTGERKIPWLLDVLLYPATLSGVIALLVIAVAPLFLQLIPWPVLFATRGFSGINIVLGLYAAWYLAECVYDSAKGGTRAPDVFTADTRLSELWSRVSYLLAVYIVFVLPPVIYGLCTRRVDAIFLGLVAWSAVFFPMGLLAMVVNDAVFVLNPLFLLGAIFRVFLAYIGLLLLIVASAFLFLLIFVRLPWTWRGIMAPLIAAYISFILAHILGRFYWRYRDRLDWGL
jgi:predicted Zn finger-like uncharacterized protein